MGIYDPPTSNLESPRGAPGVCPACSGVVSDRAVMRPTLVPNRIRCNHCGALIRLACPPLVFHLVQVLGMVAGGVGAYVALLVANAAALEDKLADFALFVLLALCFTAAAMLVLGFLEARIGKATLPFERYR